MKSKAHMKKCLELGVSVTSVDEAETEEPGMILLRGGPIISIYFLISSTRGKEPSNLFRFRHFCSKE